MRIRPHIGRILWLLAAVMSIAAWKDGDGPVITAGHEAYFGANVDERACAACAWHPKGTLLQPKEALYRFTHRGGARATVKLSHPATCEKPFNESFCVSVALDHGTDPGGRCGITFLVSMISKGVGNNPHEFSWVEARPSAARRFVGEEAPFWIEAQFVLVSGLMVFLLMALVISVGRTRPWRSLTRAEVITLVACVLLAAVLRLVVEPFPADIQLATSQGSRLVGVHNWSAAYSALLHLLFAVFPASLDTAAMANVVMACSTVVVVFVFTALYFNNRLAAFAAAAVLACQPISIRFSASDSAHIFTTLTLFMAALFVTLWLKKGGYLWALQAFGWLALCANTRIEALVCAGAIACVFGGLATRGGAATSRQFLAAGLFGIVPMALPLWDAVSTMILSPKIASINWLGAIRSPFFFSPHSPLVIVLFAALGAAVVMADGRLRRLGIFWIVAIIPVGMPTFFVQDPGMENVHRHCLPSLAMYAVVAGVGLSWLLGPALDRVFVKIGVATKGTLRPALALALVALAALPHLGFLHKTWSHQLEFEFLKANLGRVEDGCTIVAIGQREAHVGLVLFPALSYEVGRKHQWMEPSEFLSAAEPLAGCVVFIESASCHASHHPPHSPDDGLFIECREVMKRFVLEPIMKTTIPALPFGNEVFTSDPIPLGIHRVVGRSP